MMNSDLENGTPEQASDTKQEAVKESTAAGATTASSTRSSRFTRCQLISAVCIVAVVIALIVGLSVGLTRNNSGSNTDAIGSGGGGGNNGNVGGDGTSPTPQNQTNDGSDTGGPSSVISKFVVTGRAFPVELNVLTDNVLEGYNGDVEALRTDLVQVVNMYVNGAIEDYIRNYFPYNETDVSNSSGSDILFNEEASSLSAGNSADRATDFETNNQEEGVDEADLVKSDGTWVFSAYGDSLLIWDVITGTSAINYTLPALEILDSGGSGMVKDNIFIADSPMFWGAQTATINGMSLESDRLVVYVTGYGPEVLANMGRNHSCYNAFSTRIFVFDTTQLPTSLPLLVQKDVQGSFRDARAIGDNIHIVTSCDFDFYKLDQYFHRYQSKFQGLTDDEYRTEAAASVSPYIDSFVDLMITDITADGFPNIPKISLWQSNIGGNTAAVEATFNGGPVQALTSLISFNVRDVATGEELQLSNAGALTSSSWGYTYAIDGMLVYSIQGWDWMPEVNGTGQTTYLLGFSLDGASASPALLGSFAGYIRDQYSLGIYDGHIRVATTIQLFFPLMDIIAVDSENQTIWPESEIITKNQVHILKIPTAEGDKLEEVAFIGDLGEEGETFQAVRFFGDFGYAVTFLQTDPFYVLSLKPDDARVLGELKITGFSSYLHSINNNNTLLVGVGEEATTNGTLLGLQITLYDTQDPSSPQLLHRETVEQDLDTWSSSQVSFDAKAFRYLSLGDEVGIVILPVSIQSWDQASTGNFDGFYVYDVSRAGISLRMTISHVDAVDVFGGCWSMDQLPQRSLVFNGDVMTLKGHSILSTDLDTGVEQWKIDLPSSNSTVCYGWF